MEQTDIESCPCCSGKTYATCCGPCYAGHPATTALALMRSRYTAYVQQNIDYIIQTSHPSIRGSVDPASTLAWARDSHWLGLTIVATEAGGSEDVDGVVEFVARYELQGDARQHHERSRFRKLNQAWYYLAGSDPRAAGTQGVAPSILGRNTTCPCGSGKKYKRCHGA